MEVLVVGERHRFRSSDVALEGVLGALDSFLSSLLLLSIIPGADSTRLVYPAPHFLSQGFHQRQLQIVASVQKTQISLATTPPPQNTNNDAATYTRLRGPGAASPDQNENSNVLFSAVSKTRCATDSAKCGGASMNGVSQKKIGTAIRALPDESKSEPWH